MSDPSEAMQIALFGCLTADSGVAAFVAARVFDQPPPNPGFPYLTIFDVQTIEDGADCHDGSEVFIDVHAWTREVGSIEAKRLVNAVRRALHHADLDLGPAHRLLEIAFRDQRTFRDPDGLTTHAILTFRALTEPK